MASISINELSLTISELVDLDPEQQNLIESAVNRAISAKDIVGGAYYSPDLPKLAGAMAPPPPKPPGPGGPLGPLEPDDGPRPVCNRPPY
jgi:hypothetical protein